VEHPVADIVQRLPRVFSIVLAGGEGKRLWPLTQDRAKPAVPFGGVYRLVDFALSNLVNGEYRRIAVLTQYKSHSLDRHISQTWRLSPQLGNYVTSVPAQMRRGRHWFSGSGDAIYQNFNLLSDEQPDYVIVFGADHIYHMDPRQMVAHHIASGAGVTVAAIRAPRAQAEEFGVIEVDGDRIVAFHEKSSDPPTLADDPESVYASMGNYVFTAKVLIDTLSADAHDGVGFPKELHDLADGIFETDGPDGFFIKDRSVTVGREIAGADDGLDALVRGQGQQVDDGGAPGRAFLHGNLVSPQPVDAAAVGEEQ